MFNNEDKKILDFLSTFKNVYNAINRDSLKYNFNLSVDNIKNNMTDIEYTNLDTNTKSKTQMIPLAIIKDNTFTWFSNDIKDLYYDVFKKFAKMLSLSKSVVKTIDKFFANKDITFEPKYIYVVIYLITLLYKPSNMNIIRFYTDDKNSKYSNVSMFMHIKVPVEIPDILIKEFIYELRKIGNEGKKLENIHLNRVVNNFFN